MNKIQVSVSYPVGFDEDTKDMELSQCELIGLMMSNRMGSEGKYFNIKDKIFEDTKDGYSITIILEDERKNLPYVGRMGGINK